jgi:hypothetical protein
VAKPSLFARCRKKIKNAEILFFREVQAQETLFGLAYNERRRRKSWEDSTPT